MHTGYFFFVKKRGRVDDGKKLCNKEDRERKKKWYRVTTIYAIKLSDLYHQQQHESDRFNSRPINIWLSIYHQNYHTST
jgi:hypothetical protein